jgi:glycosyltransferase involved in cell wall biosynthesis
MKTSVIIPVYNESVTICELLEKVRQSPIEKEIIVVDGNSDDGTRRLLLEEEKKGDLKVIYQPVRNGRGAAIKEGVAQATGEILIFQDADLELDPAEYPKLIAPILNRSYEVVFGSRFLGKGFILGMSIGSYMANIILIAMTNILFRSCLTDVMTCYQVMLTKVFNEMDIRSNGFNSTIELTLKLVKSKYRIYEVPVNFVPRRYMHGKKIHWKDGFSSLWVILKFRFMFFRGSV